MASRPLDLAGGAPELHPDFRDLVTRARALGVRVIDRCNLTILVELGQEDLADFPAAQGVEIIASLPGYRREDVEARRGQRVFDASIAGLKRLNALGYGRGDSGLVLQLIYNPRVSICRPSSGAWRRPIGRGWPRTTASGSTVSTPWLICRCSASAAP